MDDGDDGAKTSQVKGIQMEKKCEGCQAYRGCFSMFFDLPVLLREEGSWEARNIEAVRSVQFLFAFIEVFGERCEGLKRIILIWLVVRNLLYCFICFPYIGNFIIPTD